jgi:DMSO/TMAO reductase YedYZ molybdopterin-dependent catalytic subunit
MSIFRKRTPVSPDYSERLPPGQVLTDKWPVLHYGAVPHLRTESWEFRVFGEVEEELRLDWEEFSELPTEERANDIHCVTRWSRYDNHWHGVPVRALLERVVPKPSAKFVMLHAAGGWTTNLPLEDFGREENLFATHHGGEPLTAEHGGPLRAVIPHLYFWKSAKWVKGIELMPKDKPGFWERNGYHMRGDPWKEERYGGLGWGF